MLSAVYYAATPPGSGQLLFRDPRSADPPLGDTFPYRPATGDLILFPSWMPHEVEASTTAPKEVGASTPPTRVSYAMNLPGSWATTARVHRFHASSADH